MRRASSRRRGSSETALVPVGPSGTLRVAAAAGGRAEATATPVAAGVAEPAHAVAAAAAVGKNDAEFPSDQQVRVV